MAATYASQPATHSRLRVYRCLCARRHGVLSRRLSLLLLPFLFDHVLTIRFACISHCVTARRLHNHHDAHRRLYHTSEQKRNQTNSRHRIQHTHTRNQTTQKTTPTMHNTPPKQPHYHHYHHHTSTSSRQHMSVPSPAAKIPTRVNTRFHHTYRFVGRYTTAVDRSHHTTERQSCTTYRAHRLALHSAQTTYNQPHTTLLRTHHTTRTTHTLSHASTALPPAVRLSA